MLSRFLYRRARHIAIRTEHATVARERLQQHTTAFAFEKKTGRPPSALFPSFDDHNAGM